MVLLVSATVGLGVTISDRLEAKSQNPYGHPRAKSKLVGGFGLGLNGMPDLEGAVWLSFSLLIITTDCLQISNVLLH